jgi:hypothetical protein
MLAISGAAASIAAVVGVVGSPAAAAGPARVVKQKAPACSTDIIGRGPGSAVGRHIEFSYTLDGAACRTSLYALIVKNTYDPRQVAVFIKLGDGKSKDIFFSERLPWTPTPSPVAEGSDGTEGLCVIGVTTRGLHIDDVAPDPQDGPCEPLHGGTARAFH